MRTFYRKNDIGVEYEYTVIGQYEEDGINYILYTDFVEDKNDVAGIRTFVAIDNENLDPVSEEKRKEIITNMYNSLIEQYESQVNE